MTMKISSDLLAGMYKLPHQAAVPHQGSGACKEYLKVLAWCLFPIWEAVSPPPWCDDDEFQVICDCRQFLENSCDDRLLKVEFLAEYGCAILTHKSDQQLRRTVFVTVLGLDKYFFEMHTKGQSTIQGGHQFLGTPSEEALLHVGQFEESKLDLFFERFKGILAKAKKKSDEGRSASGGKQVHQFTPAFIHALLLQAKACKCEPSECQCLEVKPKGGFTDNGLHTGGILRNTSFPLVMSILQWLLDQSGAMDRNLCPKVGVFIHLRVAENLLSHTEGISIDNDESNCEAVGNNEEFAEVGIKDIPGIRLHLDWAKKIINDASITAANLHYDDPRVEGLLPHAAKLDAKISSCAEDLAKHESKKFTLPDVKAIFEAPGAFSYPTLKIPGTSVKRDKNVSDKEVQRRIRANIGLFPILEDPSLADVFVVRDWAKKLDGKTKDVNSTWALLKGIERYLWQHAAKGFESNTNVDDACIDALDEIVHTYCPTLRILRSTFDNGSESPVELRSREVLVVWIAYCQVFATCKARHATILEGVGVALDFHWLGQLVLSDRASWEAAKSVASYLASQTKKGAELFSLCNQEPTYRFAEKYSEQNLLSIWETEKRIAESRMQARWEEIQQKKREAEALRTTISSLERRLKRANAAVCSAQSDLDYASRYNRSLLQSELEDCQDKANRIERQLNNEKADLRRVLHAPEPILQPLPSIKSTALQLLFFHYMPKIFRVLSDLTLTGQQLLIPDELSEEEKSRLTAVSGCAEELVDYYNNQQQTRFLSSPLRGTNGTVHLRSVESVAKAIPKSIGSTNVDYCHDRSNGVWHPDSVAPRMAWTGGRHYWHQIGGGELNPFCVTKACVVTVFTEQLNPQDEVLQWALRGPWEKTLRDTRGNLVHARQHLKPSSMSKDQYLSFCTFRAFPHLQLRNLGRCLVDALLPIGVSATQVLIRQSLFQLGELAVDKQENAILQWKRDMIDGNYFDSIFPIFRHVVADIEQSPQQSSAAVFVGILCNFFSDFSSNHDDGFKSLSRRLANALFSWAEDLQSAIDEAIGDGLLDLRVRQCVLLYQSIMCLSSGKLSGGDCADIIKRLVFAHNICLENFEDDKLKFVEGLKSNCAKNGSQSLAIIRRAVMQDTGILTAAVRGVCDKAPPKLAWVQVPTQNNDVSTCFQTKANDGNTFSLNYLTGAVLVNGLPPRSLPAEVLQHPLYKRVFGETNFEVFINKDEVFVTQRKVNGCHYEFFLRGEDLCVVEEVEAESHEYRFELLDGRPQESDKWGDTLPIRLRRMHSHWLCREQRVILLRGQHFSSVEFPFFLQLQSENWISEVSVKCKCVPTQSRHKAWLDVVPRSEHLDTLVLHSSLLVPVLKKFEDPDFIHFIEKANEERAIIIDMPRLKLSFVWDIKGRLCCQELAGFKLSRVQQLDDTLYGFYQYLVLSQLAPDKAFAGAVCIIVIDGTVEQERQHHTPIMTYSDSYEAELSWSRFDIHGRFRRLEATTIYSRLQLTSLHLGTACLFIEKRTKMTGVERATELLRQCWSSKPFSTEERDSLNTVWTLSRGAYPCVSLLCLDLNQSSEQVSFLYHSYRDGGAKNLETASTTNSFEFNLPTDDRIAYVSEMASSSCVSRVRLYKQEELRILGHRLRPHKLLRLKTTRIKSVKNAPLHSDEVHELEQVFFKLVSMQSVSDDHIIAPFPLACKGGSSELEKDFHDELKTSWNAYSEMSSFRVDCDTQSASRTVVEFTPVIVSARLRMENFLLRKLSMHYDLSGGEIIRSAACAFLQIGGCIPYATTADLVSSIYWPEKLQDSNPCLSKEEIHVIKSNIILWMRLCRLEDKLNRLRFYASKSDADEFLNELCISSSWDPSAHPYWLAFEVEGALQIRPEQFEVAFHLIRSPSHILQLQMGKGKTRVILPMLILHWAFNLDRCHRLSRLNIFSALIGEAYEFFHLHLTASLAQLKLFMMPFNRDIPLDECLVGSMERLVSQCFCEKGFFLVAPEHRLSLKLKFAELEIEGRHSVREKLASIAVNENWRDILDESDELLHTRYQLIYAVGDVDELPGGLARYQAAQTVLEALMSSASIDQWIASNPGTVLRGSFNFEAFPQVRVTKKMSRDSLHPEFREVLAKAIVSNPPYELDWMKNHLLEDRIVQFLADPSETFTHLEGLPEEQVDDILAIRGHLAGDILVSCLTKLHRVNYGIARGMGRKRICVPFRGADTPSLRSEFAHPDVTIMLTTLSYYYDGLSESELEQAFNTLLGLGQSAKQELYSNWFELSKLRIKIEDPIISVDFDRVEKLDLSNRNQFKHLVKYFSFNIRTINFWLNSCVFPEEMQQYPKRLSANSWHLAENLDSGVIGFSGTNDNHRNLPLLVKQFFPERKSLRTDSSSNDFVWQDILSTNGRMLDIIIRNTLHCDAFQSEVGFDSILAIISQAKHNVGAIIDAGAVLAGMRNADVAEKILPLVRTRYRGVLFHDNAGTPTEGNWKILEQNKRIRQKANSPIVESDAFAIFDEPRCRGSDLKLSRTTLAILTLGPGMCKDKLLQAAGRLRKLRVDGSQKLIIVGSQDIMNEISYGDGDGDGVVTAKHILEWAVRNTIDSNSTFMVDWANQGLFYCTSKGAHSKKCIENEKLSPRDSYGGSFDRIPAFQAVSIAKEYHIARTGWDGSQDIEMSQILEKIMFQARHFGSHLVRAVGGTDEECERELELEREREEEEEIEIPSMVAFREVQWDVVSVLNCQNVASVSVAADVKALAIFQENALEPESLQRINWSGKVFGTRNFYWTVTNKNGDLPSNMNHYLRIVDVYIRFPSNEILLISEREADILLDELWRQPKSSLLPLIPRGALVSLGHLSFARTLADGTIKGFPPSAFCVHAHAGRRPTQNVVTEMQLFAGETAFHKRCSILEQFLRVMKRNKRDGKDNSVRSGSGEPAHLVAMRGRSHNFAYSDLEKVCKKVAQEAGEGVALGSLTDYEAKH